MIRRALCLVLPVAIVGSLLLVLPVAGAQVGTPTTTPPRAPPTTAPPPTTTTTTLPPVFGFEGECWVEFDFGQAGNVVAPGAMFAVRGGGFMGDPDAQPVMIGTPHGGEDWATVIPDADGGFEVEVMVPDWPHAAYLLVARQGDDSDGGCSGMTRVLVDQPDDPRPGSCSIRILQIIDETAPFFMRGAYVTHGMGFMPGEMVTMSRDGSVVLGPFGPIEPDGTFVMPFAPPMDDTAGPVEWQVITRFCVATAMVTPYSGESPLMIAPEALAGGGVRGVFDHCELIVYKETLSPIPGVDASYQSPVAENFVVAFGKGFTPGEEVGFLVDGQPFDLVGPTLLVDSAGKFYTDTGSGLSNLSQVAPPYVLTAETESCNASAYYVEFPRFDVPGDNGGLLLATVVAEGPVPLVGIGSPVWVSLDDCGIMVWRGFPYESDDPNDQNPPSGLPLDQWKFGSSADMYVWGSHFTPGELVEAQIDGHPVGLAISSNWPPGVTETVQGDGTIGRFGILNRYTDGNGVYHEFWSQDGGYCPFPCQFVLTVVTPSCTASALYNEFEFPDSSDIVLDTIGLPGPPVDEVVLPVDITPEDGLAASEMLALALVGIGFGVGGFVGGGAMAARGMLGHGAEGIIDDNLPSPGHGAEGIIDDNLPGGQGLA